MGLENLRRMYEPIPTWTLGDRLRKIRRDNADGITQKAFAESISVGGPAYTAWEGDRSFPREPDDLAERIYYVWGVPKWWTLGKEPPHRPSVRREGLEPPTRCLGADDNVIPLFPTTALREAS